VQNRHAFGGGGHVPAASSSTRTLKTSEAAALLNVSPNTIRAWERRFGYPKPGRSPGKHRLYSYAEIAALRDALEDGLSISSAVSVARDAFGADAQALVSALIAFRADLADEVLDGSLALRSVERSVEDVLLPAVDTVRQRKGPTSATTAFALAWSEDWLLRARRLARVVERRVSVLIGDASLSPLDAARPYVLAFALCCVRSGVDVLTLPVSAPERLWEAVAAIKPAAVVIAGGHASDDEVANWAYKVNATGGQLPFALYRREPHALTSNGRTPILPVSPVAALGELLELTEAISAEPHEKRPYGQTGAPAGEGKTRPSRHARAP
jgi:hypothetical protein